MNKTPDRYFKFEWPSNDNIIFVPKEGHLGPTNFKEITITFFATEPIELIEVRWYTIYVSWYNVA